MSTDQYHNANVPLWFSGSDNMHRVARTIAQRGPISRIQLTHMLGLSQGALSRITADLLHEGVIEEVNTFTPGILDEGKENDASEHRGRPQTGLQLRTDQVSFIGINIHGKEIIMEHINVLCQPYAPSYSEPLESFEPHALAEQIARMIPQCTAPHTPPLAAVGISVGGHHTQDRYVQYAPFLRWNSSVDLGGMVSDTTGLPCAIFNDIDSLLLKEGWFGSATGLHSYAVLTIGAGVGYSLAVDGKAVNYPDKSFGLVGHIPLDFTGPRCSIGHVGCSSILTSDSIAAEYSAEVGHAVSYEQFEQDARAFVPAAVRLAARTAHRLGTLIAIVANIAMPQKIIISGEGSGIAAMNIEEVRTGITQYRHSQAQAVDFEILQFTWSDWAQAAGARAIARYIG